MASSASRPLIGLTTYLQRGTWGDWSEEAAILPASYLRAVVDAGGSPVLLPPIGTEEAALDGLHGLVVVGGTDVGAERYGARPHPLTRAQPARDEHDLRLTRAALARGLPLLAICRGAQILNVAGGGTLHQHVPEAVPGSDYRREVGVFGSVDFETRPGSAARALLGERASAPCYHHQSLDRIAPGYRVTAAAADGTVEVIEPESPAPGASGSSGSAGSAESSGSSESGSGAAPAGFVLGVQFHPEQNPEDGRVFAGFLTAARAYREERAGRASATIDHPRASHPRAEGTPS